MTDDVWQNVLDLQAAIDRDREQRGPFVREFRCGTTVLRYMALKLPVGERKPWEPQPFGIPVVKDGDVPARCLRRVYDDGATEDVEVVSEAVESILEAMPETIEFTPPPTPNRLTDIYRYGVIAQPPTWSILGGFGS